MQAGKELREVDQVEILTLADNYVDLLTMDSNEIILRAMPIKDLKVKGTVLAEHGFAALIKTMVGDESHTILFDFGFSETTAIFNARQLDLDLSEVEAAILSHGHMDHFGGLVPMIEALPNRPIPLYLHPGAFLKPRFIKGGEVRIMFPAADREAWEQAGVKIMENAGPLPIAGNTILYLGEIERTTDFEQGMPNVYFEKDGVEQWDPIIDDTGIAVNLRGKGLVVVSGCSHAGIVNTSIYARKVTGVDRIHVVMGGFHLTGPALVHAIQPTIAGLQGLDPDYIVPTHCTGRKAVMAFEESMPEKFILNMSGTRLTFRA